MQHYNQDVIFSEEFIGQRPEEKIVFHLILCM